MTHRAPHRRPPPPGLAGMAGLFLVAGCSGPQSMMDPAGPGAAAINTLWWVLLFVLTAVFLLVMLALGVAIFRRRGPAAPAGGRSGAGSAEAERRRLLWVLVAGAAVPAVILLGIFVYTLVVLDRIGPSGADGDLTVVVTGKQFWWEVEYLLPGGEAFRTANEIHVPTGRRVTLLLESDNVIHSLWIPRLHGKTDLIPGRTNEMWLEVSEPGVYRGQCAEYCGAQHTWMALLVVAQPEDEFRGWIARQRRPATPVPPPAAESEALSEPGPLTSPTSPAGTQAAADADTAAARARTERIWAGRAAFLDPENRCAECHVIRGVTEGRPGAAAGASPGERPLDGPDLTHLASRRYLAGGLLPNNRGSLAGWIANPQVLKPGNLMPRIPLEPAELGALTEYLMTLR